MRALFALVLILSLAACGLRRVEAPVADANPQCYQQYVVSATDTGVRWEGSPEDPATWDDLGLRVVPALAGVALGTERSRQSCVDFINSLKKRAVIRAKENP